MVDNRHYEDQLILSLQQRESAYNVPLATWDNTTATTMRDISDQASHELWDDLVPGAQFIRMGHTVSRDQAMAQQSVRIPYGEPRCKPHTLAGLMGLSMGTVTSTSQSFLTAYRHALTLAALSDVPSISAMTGHQRNHYLIYGGIKADGFTLSAQQASPYLSFSCPLVGAGSRADSSPVTFPASIVEDWLRLGDCRAWFLDITDTPLALPPLPAVLTPLDQGTPTLGAAAIDVSSRVLALAIQQLSALSASQAYRVSSGLQRANYYAPQQTFELHCTLQVNTTREAEELAWYLNQRHLAFEWQCVSSVAIDPVTITNVTAGTPPTHHIVTDSNAGTWYVFPDSLGELVAQTSPPAGTGLNVGTGIVLRALDGWNYRIGVDPLGEVLTTQTTFGGTSPHIVELCALRDASGTTWYLWNDGLGEVALSMTPTPIVPWHYGATILCPLVQWRAVVRQHQNQSDTVELTGTVLDGGSYEPVLGWVYNKQPTYLQAP